MRGVAHVTEWGLEEEGRGGHGWGFGGLVLELGERLRWWFGGDVC